MHHRIGSGGRKYYGKKGAGILFTDGKQILLIRRAKGDHKHTWGIPGGKAKSGESAIDTAKRETKEEVGKIQGARFARFDEKDNKHTFVVFLYKIDKPFDIELSDEHDMSKWVDIDNITEYELHPRFKESWTYYLKSIKKHFPRNFSEWLTNFN